MHGKVFPNIVTWKESQSIRVEIALSDIRTQIRRNVRDTSATASLQRYSDSVLTDFSNQAQRAIVNSTWVISKSTTITLSAGTTYYTLPTDTIEIERATRQYGNLAEVKLQQLDADNANADWETTGGTPLYFFQDKAQSNKIGLQPFPNSAGNAGTLRIIYYALPVDLSADSDKPFSAEDRYRPYDDLLVFFVTYRIFLIEGYQDRASIFRQEYDDLLQIMNANIGKKPLLVTTPKEKKE